MCYSVFLQTGGTDERIQNDGLTGKVIDDDCQCVRMKVQLSVIYSL